MRKLRGMVTEAAEGFFHVIQSLTALAAENIPSNLSFPMPYYPYLPSIPPLTLNHVWLENKRLLRPFRPQFNAIALQRQ